MTSRRYIHRITFRGPVITTATSGQTQRAYEDKFNRRAFVEQTGGGKEQSTGQQAQTKTFQIELPHDSELETTGGDWQIVWKDSGETMNITDVSTDRSSRTPITTIAGTLNK